MHQYSMKQACEEGVICEVNAESRVGGFQWHLNAEELDQEFEDEFEELSPKERKELLSRRLDAHSLSELPSRADAITNDIANHFLESVDPNGLKGMVVTPSRTAAAMYGQRLQQILQAEEVAVLITDRKNDGDILKQFHTTSKEREKIIDNFKKQGENPKILVVCDMLLTGFDAPILKTIYLDKPLRDHTLMQAIARTNRPRDGKQNGEIIDYRGVVDDIESIFDYSEEDTETYITHDNERFIDEFIDTLDVLKALFDEVDWERRPDSPETVQKWLNCLRTEQERATFQNKWKKLQRLFETISPDKRLVEHEDDYKWIGQLYASFQSSNKGARVSDELQKKTLRLIEENITIEEIERDFPKYTISGREVSNGPLEIKRKETGLQDVLNQGAYFDPRYKQLSERVKEIIEKWNQEVHSDEEALDELRDVEDEVQKIQHERTSKNINKSERAIIGLLETDFSDSIENKKEARNIAESIEINFQKHIDTTVPNWKTNDYTQRQIRNQVRKALITGENRYLSLSSSDEFVEKATKYLIRNH